MAALSKLQLKQLWKAYFQPTSADFSNLIDSWTDYSPALEAVGAAVSGGSTGVVNVTSPSTIAFLASGATGQAVLAAVTQASARSAIGLPLPVSIANGGTSAADAATARINLGVADATESAPGRIEIATQVEANAGTDDTRALTPAKLANISPASVTLDATNDQVLILDASDSNKLKRAAITQGVTSITAGAGLTGGTITTTGTVALDVYTGSSATNTDFPVGTTVLVQLTGTTPYDRGASNAIKYATGNNKDFVDSAGTGTTLTGTWRARGAFTVVGLQLVGESYVTVTTVAQLFQRTA